MWVGGGTATHTHIILIDLRVSAATFIQIIEEVDSIFAKPCPHVVVAVVKTLHIRSGTGNLVSMLLFISCSVPVLTVTE